MRSPDSPLEAGLGWIVKLQKARRRLIGQEALKAQKAEGSSAKLVGLTLTEKGIPADATRC